MLFSFQILTNCYILGYGLMYIVLLILTLRSAYTYMYKLNYIKIFPIKIKLRNLVKHHNQNHGESKTEQNVLGLFRYIHLSTEANGFILTISARTELADMI
jgi:hypothetical protein